MAGQRRIVLLAVASHPNLTAHELAEFVGFDSIRITRRLGDHQRRDESKGWFQAVQKSGERKCRCGNCKFAMMSTWELTAIGRDMAEAMK